MGVYEIRKIRPGFAAVISSKRSVSTSTMRSGPVDLNVRYASYRGLNGPRPGSTHTVRVRAGFEPG